MIVEHPDIPAARIGSVVCREWAVEVTHAEHVEVGAGSWHWALGDDTGPQWFATMEMVRTADERRRRLSAFEAGVVLGHRLTFVVAPVHTRDARVAVDIAPGLLLTLTPHQDGRTMGAGPFTDDAERSIVASMMGDVHRQPRPRHLPLWRPGIGRHAPPQGDHPERWVDREQWSGGPWSVPVGRLVADARPVLHQALRRFALLGAAVAGNIDRWVVTHGEPHTANLLQTLDGPRLVSWGTTALAPRERDLREALGDAEGDAPWYSYLEAGGRPDPLSADTVELFALQWHLCEIVEYLVRFSRPHEDTADERRCFEHLEGAVGALLARWA